MLTELTIAFGRRVFRAIGLDLAPPRIPITAPNLVPACEIADGLARIICGWITWITLWIVVGVPMVIATALLAGASPREHSLVAYFFAFPLAFVTTGFVLFTARFGIVAPLAQRASRQLRSRRVYGAEPIEIRPMSPLTRHLISPGDHDFVLAAVVALLVALLARPMLN